jgi:hypothetical protein
MMIPPVRRGWWFEDLRTGFEVPPSTGTQKNGCVVEKPAAKPDKLCALWIVPAIQFANFVQLSSVMSMHRRRAPKGLRSRPARPPGERLQAAEAAQQTKESSLDG